MILGLKRFPLKKLNVNIFLFFFKREKHDKLKFLEDLKIITEGDDVSNEY